MMLGYDHGRSFPSPILTFTLIVLRLRPSYWGTNVPGSCDRLVSQISSLAFNCTRHMFRQGLVECYGCMCVCNRRRRIVVFDHNKLVSFGLVTLHAENNNLGTNTLRNIEKLSDETLKTHTYRLHPNLASREVRDVETPSGSGGGEEEWLVFHGVL